MTTGRMLRSKGLLPNSCQVCLGIRIPQVPLCHQSLLPLRNIITTLQYIAIILISTRDENLSEANICTNNDIASLKASTSTPPGSFSDGGNGLNLNLHSLYDIDCYYHHRSLVLPTLASAIHKLHTTACR